MGVYRVSLPENAQSVIDGDRSQTERTCLDIDKAQIIIFCNHKYLAQPEFCNFCIMNVYALTKRVSSKWICNLLVVNSKKNKKKHTPNNNKRTANKQETTISLCELFFFFSPVAVACLFCVNIYYFFFFFFKFIFLIIIYWWSEVVLHRTL